MVGGRDGETQRRRDEVEEQRELTLRQLVGLGMCELRSRVHRRQIRGRHVWVALKGAMRYHYALDMGDVASNADQARRAAACHGCEHRRFRDVETGGEKVVAGYCGEPFVDKSGTDPSTCGCLVTVSVLGETLATHAAGRAVVASERCPLKRPRWLPVDPIGPGSERGPNAGRE